MLIARPRWGSNALSACNRAITDACARPSYSVLCKLNGLLVRLRHSPTLNFIDNREAYYNFRHDGSVLFGVYNLKASGTLIKGVFQGGIPSNVSNSHILFNGTAGYMTTNVQLNEYGLYTRLSNSHHYGLKVANPSGGFVYGNNESGSNYTMISNGGGSIRLNSAGLGVDPGGGVSVHTIGKYKVGRKDATTITVNKDGAFVEDITLAVEASLTTRPIFLGVRNNVGAPSGPAGVALSYYASGPLTTDAQDLEIYNAETLFEAHLLETP